MLYPLFFKPVYKTTIWGGRNFKRVFNRDIPDGKIAESWEVCCHKNDTSIIANGPLKEKTLQYIFENYKKELIGSKFDKYDRFPLLIKFIDANDRLSVQVHPGNAYAQKVEGDSGKTEMWYVIDAKKDAKLICGTKKGTNRENFKKAIENGNIEDYLNFVNVKKGDCVYIPSGTVHAIMDGLLIAEIQQSSDITYRVYDWGRVDKNGKSRELHVDKALDVINFNYESNVISPEVNSFSGYKIEKLVENDYFTTNKIVINGTYKDKTLESFYTYVCVEGTGKLQYKDATYDINAGESFLIPSCLESFSISGNLTLLKSFI